MLLISFSNIKIKAYLQILKNLTQFFAYLLFQIIKKVYLQILKNLTQCLASLLFQILKKVCLQILKNLAQFFCLFPFQILRILKTPLFIPITIYIKTIIQTILIKTIIQINKHKAKYITNACIPIIIIISKISLPHNNKKRFFLLNIRVVNQGLNL